MDLKERLQKYYPFTEQDLTTTLSYFVPDKISAKSYFLKKGNVSDKIAFIRSGLLRSFIYNDNADDITTHFFQTGKVVISMESFNNQVPSKEFIIAVEDSDLLVITWQKMQELRQKVPVWYQIIKDVDEYKFKEQMNRSIRFQTLSATERYQLLLQKKPDIIQKVALRHIASYLGIDIATLSRIRKKL
jgi:CRP/FNR family transcriptional regulator, anaerobic regulatory protein